MANLSIPIAKAGNATVDIDTDALPEDMFKLAIVEGLKVLLNKRMSKVGSVTKLEGEEKDKAHAAALAIAHENRDNILAGKASSRAASGKSKVSGVVMTEARRLAKEVVKNTIRANGLKVSHVEAKDITAMANKLLEADPSFIASAEANIEARKAKTTTDKAAAESLLNSLGGVHVSDKKVAAANKAAAEKKSQLSAKQASMVAPRKTAEHTVHH